MAHKDQSSLRSDVGSVILEGILLAAAPVLRRVACPPSR
jgi:hypothetical protein